MSEETARPLTTSEFAIVSALLALALRDAERLRAQSASLQVTGVCRCGCLTVSFKPGPPDGIELVADADVAGSVGDAVLLFASAEGLDSPEYVWVGELLPTEWPPPTSLLNLRVR